MKKRLAAILLSGIMAVTALTGCQLGSGRSGSSEGSWPEKDITIICTHDAGGDTDYNARLMSRMLEEELGVSVVVNNVTGSNGAIALAQYKDETPDGYTFVMTNTACLTGNLATGLSDFGYEAFEVVGIYGKQAGENIIVPADSPYQTLEDLVNASIENPGAIKFGISTGGGIYIASTILEKEYNAQFNIIDAGDGASRMTSLLGGHVDVTAVSYSAAKEYIENGDVRSLCTFLEETPDLIEGIPTACSQGYENVILNTEYVCLAPKGTDEAVVKAMNDAMMNIIENNEEYKEEVNSYNFQEPFGLSPEDSVEELKAQTDRFMEYAEFLK